MLPRMTKTTDLCDAHPDDVRVPEPVFRSFGARRAFEGPIATIQVHEDNALVRKELEQPGEGRVLVIDGGGSLRRALVGDQLAALAQRNGWAGIVVNGCVRDSAEIAAIEIGVLALATCPRRSEKRGTGAVGETVVIAGASFVPGHYLWADEDGVVVAGARLLV